jgi:hypothetical protein
MLPQGESLNGRARDELLNIEEFATLTEARVSSKPGNGVQHLSARLVAWPAHAHRIQMAVDRTTPTRTLIVG